MKELIGKLSRGAIEYEQPIVEASIAQIEKEILEGQKYKGAFTIFCENDSKLKGIVYSTNESVHILADKFVGQNNIIEYVVETSGLEDGCKIEGMFNIVTNGGEIVIPYTFAVFMNGLECSKGKIEDLFQFTNLVQTQYEEALKLFQDKKFTRCLLREHLSEQALYEGLINSKNVNLALEEFLIGINKKQRVGFDIEDRSREYDSLEGDYGDIILISKDGWGYAEINITVQGDFISDCKNRLTTDDFAGKHYEYSYTIKPDKLHDGMNYGRIIFSTEFQRMDVKITVDNVHDHDVGYFERKKCAIKLTDMYLKFRMRKIGVNEWAEDSLQAIERVRGFDDSSEFIKLVQAQIYLSRSMDEQATWLLGNVAEEILDEREENVELYAYYLYVRTLQKRNPEMTTDVLHKVKHYYENGYDSWKLLWILFYLDNAYENNKSLKIARIKEQYNKGCRSPLMYYEALNAFNRQPVLLRVLNDFEVQVLVFGCKYETINLKLALQVVELAMLEKKFKPLIYKILTSLYNRFENREILEAICSMLIKGNKTGRSYFKWFALGIAADIKLAKLYEYYIFSIDDSIEAEFPEILLMYFSQNGDTLREKQEILYSYIVENATKIPGIYQKYEDAIERFALEQIRLGRMNEQLASIYRYVLKESMITTEIAANLAGIMSTYKIECFNEEICEVIVIHKEITGEQRYPVRNGQAFIKKYTEEPAIIFADSKGNRFSKTINYTIKHLYPGQNYMKLCEEIQLNDSFIMAETAEKLLKYHHAKEKAMSLFKRIMQCDDFRVNYKISIMDDVVDFYYNNYDGDELDMYLRHINRSYMDKDTRIKVVELMLLRGINEEADSFMRQYGIAGISPRKILKYCTRMLAVSEYEKDEHMLALCMYAFNKGKYNEPVLKYLCRYYNGTTKEMLDIWKTAKSYGYEDREFEERLIAQMLFTRTKLSSIVNVYDSYYENGASGEVKKAFLFYEAYLYMVKEQPVDNGVFKYLAMELEHRDTLNDMCAAALVKYYSENECEKDTLELCGNLIGQLVKNNIFFDFYKKYWKKIFIPPEIMENTVVEYRTIPDKKVYIHYILSDRDAKDKEYVTEEMQQMFPGVYTKKILMFYGEHLMYYVTEESNADEKLTESRDYYIGDGNVDFDDSRYARLNEVLVCKEMKEESTIREMMKNYELECRVAKKIF